jgi:hypothetical protein
LFGWVPLRLHVVFWNHPFCRSFHFQFSHSWIWFSSSRQLCLITANRSVLVCWYRLRQNNYSLEKKIVKIMILTVIMISSSFVSAAESIVILTFYIDQTLMNIWKREFELDCIKHYKEGLYLFSTCSNSRIIIHIWTLYINNKLKHK